MKPLDTNFLVALKRRNLSAMLQLLLQSEQTARSTNDGSSNSIIIIILIYSNNNTSNNNSKNNNNNNNNNSNSRAKLSSLGGDVKQNAICFSSTSQCKLRTLLVLLKPCLLRDDF